MKLSNQELDDLITSIVGEDVLPLVQILRTKNNISEFKLAEMLNITVNQTRNMLYRLNEQNLVNFLRKKDKKKGWYIYYWSFNKKGIENAWTKNCQKQLEDFKARLRREEEGMFYVCPQGCMRLPMETAMEFEFRCQECGTLMKEQENQKTIMNIKKLIQDLEKKIQEPPQEEKKKKQVKKKKEIKKTVKKAIKKFLKKKKTAAKKKL
ncbi:hypothetical protein HZA98_02675 [Candidatus Woesearchaeota archaeon]|nr:hypothetical protein [Candidatus Woesearchaeota archaeon]